MKRVLSAILSATLLLTLTGCQKDNENVGDKDSSSRQTDTSEQTSNTDSEQSGTKQQSNISINENVKYTGDPSFFFFTTYQDGTCKVEANRHKMTDEEVVLIIPSVSPSGDNVIEIAERGFYGYENIKGIIIPFGVEEISSDAFSCCTSLAEVSLPESLKKWAQVVLIHAHHLPSWIYRTISHRQISILFQTAHRLLTYPFRKE